MVDLARQCRSAGASPVTRVPAWLRNNPRQIIKRQAVQNSNEAECASPRNCWLVLPFATFLTKQQELFDAPHRSGVCSYYPGLNASAESFLNIHDAKKLGPGSLSTYCACLKHNFKAQLVRFSNI